MYTYKLKFDNGKKFTSRTENLDQTHTKIVKYINKNDLKECTIICPNGAIRRVRKTGEVHWNHSGFQFD
jgi:Pyruvate/2-oxoacid:ferredoxin oxidoreductase delta subunit